MGLLRCVWFVFESAKFILITLILLILFRHGNFSKLGEDSGFAPSHAKP